MFRFLIFYIDLFSWRYYFLLKCKYLKLYLICALSSCHMGLRGHLRFYRDCFSVGMKRKVLKRDKWSHEGEYYRVNVGYLDHISNFKKPHRNKIIRGNRYCPLNIQKLLICIYLLGNWKDYLTYECLCLSTKLLYLLTIKVESLFNQSKKWTRKIRQVECRHDQKV